jgi:hypothetical protein
MSLLKSAGNIYFAYQFLTKLTTPFEKTEAYKLGIIDKNGKVLKKRSTLKSQEEKDAYTITDTMIFNLKKLLGKVPGGRSRFATFAAALFLLKEDLTYRHYQDQSFLQEEFFKFMKTDEKDVQLVREQITLREKYLDELDAGSGNIASIGIGPDGEPPGITAAQKKKKREKFAGAEVFTVDPNVFMKARFGKKKYAKYENYVGNDEIGQEIRQYGRANPSKPIIIKDSLTGAMLYLKYGKDNARIQNFY